LSIGDAIIDSETEDCVTIRYIKDYCESIFNIHQSISEDTDIKEVEKTLNHDLTLIKKSIEKDIIGKIEVVFLPYKASMWDSLESVWKAADEDPDCDAYVVPIPYYDRNPDHSFGEFHYEGGEYPDYVPVTHYNNYDISKRRPDVIYIHNPYDDCNYVTSVDPRFYSRELKKYTDKLVYIPYFVLAEPDPNNPKSVESVSHFVLTPGVINADEVIVQSEDMKQTYINVLLGHFGDTVENRKRFEGKIYGTGSPKFDKVASKSKEDISIPDEWLKIIKKPDGTWKKIVFYNTSISTMLQFNEQYIAKIKNVLNYFSKKTSDLVLLWRPHPLLHSTLSSMRPDLLIEYDIITQKYIMESWGIYDDTSDLDRAVIISDAYYGDWSSVMHIYEKTQKPVLVQIPDRIY
ncbi:MAG: CDP-glycerol glycerophosphotransferase family protein, partial [Oscillospiraceae bacterium]|nr:CDP-glycerol glycerophosphotransferase family protein [Oscillospiraceae bacterium]